MRQARFIQKIRRLSCIDSVTGLPNLRGMRRWGKAVLSPGSHAYVSMDIHDFKNFNVCYGYAAGNELLQHISQTLQQALDKDETVCRGGGDEFILLLRWPGSMPSLKVRLRRMAQQVQARNNPAEQHRFNLILRVGIYHMDTKRVSLRMAGYRAATARNLCKNARHSSFGVYDAALHARLSQERQFEREMVTAQARGEFFMRVQPKCDLHTGRVVGGEALVRWRHPLQGEIPPANFVALFEQNGFIVHLDMYILETVCGTLRGWLDKGWEPMPLSVNMSRLHFMDEDFVNNVIAVISHHRLDPQLIELEITESVYLKSTTRLVDIMDQLSAFGVRFSMDDFGAGYSSLNMLKEIPVDILKLDREFLDSGDSARSHSIISHVVNMAHALNVQVVCEGIETAGQAEVLRRMRCDMGQGYYFAPPLELPEFEAMAFPSAGTQPLHAPTTRLYSS